MWEGGEGREGKERGNRILCWFFFFFLKGHFKSCFPSPPFCPCGVQLSGECS